MFYVGDVFHRTFPKPSSATPGEMDVQWTDFRLDNGKVQVLVLSQKRPNFIANPQSTCDCKETEDVLERSWDEEAATKNLQAHLDFLQDMLNKKDAVSDYSVMISSTNSAAFDSFSDRCMCKVDLRDRFSGKRLYVWQPFYPQENPFGQQKIKSDCADHNEKCCQWATKGDCDTNVYWMRVKCPLSCGTCGASSYTANDLQPKPISNCNPTPPSIQTTQSTKGPPFGNQDCPDNHLLCNYWKSIGECEKNSKYMNLYCKKACKVCGGNLKSEENTLTTPGYNGMLL